MNTVSWLNYLFTVYDPNTSWNDVGGIYIFSGLNQNRLWVAHYIGQTNSFKNRLSNHDQWYPAVRLGATHVHAMGALLLASLDTIEEQLIRAYQPSLNVHLK
jgi:hypothetical protein